jgi:putative nucleotidyltransferase-like protein
MTASATDVVRGVAGYGLPGAAVALPQALLDDKAWEAVLAGVSGQRLTGHMVRALDDGAFMANDDQQAAALEAHERALAVELVLERLLLTTMYQLDAASIAARVLRGPAVAHSVYLDPGLRSFADVDVLVASWDYDAALALLCAHGARRRYQEPRKGFDRRFGKGVCLEIPGGLGLEIDLHRTFVAGPFGLAVDTGALFESSTTFHLGGQELHGLDPESRFLDSCFHAALGRKQPRLVAWRDVAQMILCAPLDADRVRERCRAWRCGVVVQRAIGLAWDAFALDSTPEVVRWARSQESSVFEQRALRAYVSSDRSYASQAVAGLQAVRSRREKVRYATALLVPNRAYVRMREGSYRRRVRRALRLFREESRRQLSGDTPSG